MPIPAFKLDAAPRRPLRARRRRNHRATRPQQRSRRPDGGLHALGVIMASIAKLGFDVFVILNWAGSKAN
jgi:hypothetical protein